MRRVSGCRRKSRLLRTLEDFLTWSLLMRCLFKKCGWGRTDDDGASPTPVQSLTDGPSKTVRNYCGSPSIPRPNIWKASIRVLTNPTPAPAMKLSVRIFASANTRRMIASSIERSIFAIPALQESYGPPREPPWLGESGVFCCTFMFAHT